MAWNKKEILGRCALIFGSLLFVLIVLEVMFRIVGLHRPVLYRADEAAGYSLQENQETSYLFNHIKVNDLGFRDERESSDLEQMNSKKIGVFGDSVTWGGVYIKQNELFTHLLEEKIKDSIVLNGGVNGYSVKQAVERAKDISKQTELDQIIIYIIEGDFYRNPEVTIKYDAAPFYLSHRTFALGQVWNVSKAVIFQKTGWEFLRSPTAVEKLEQLSEEEVIERNIQSLISYAEELKAEGKKELIVFLSPQKKLLKEDSESYDRIRDRLAENIDQFHDLLPDFREREDAESFYYDSVHFNEEGHRAVAELLMKYISE